MTLGTLLLIVLILLLLGAVPAWPYSREWGYYPSGILGTLILIIILFALLGYLPLIKQDITNGSTVNSVPIVAPGPAVNPPPVHSPSGSDTRK